MSELALEQDSSNKMMDTPLLDSETPLSPFDETFRQIDISSIAENSELADTIPFFMGGDRRAVLDEMMHLCQFSNNIVAVLGEAGIGKTAFAYQAVVELSDTAQCCVLSSSVMIEEEEVLRQLIDQLGLFAPDLASVDDMLSVIYQYQPTGLHQRVVIVVDDAHHLSSPILALFIRLLQHQDAQYFHVLFVGDSSLLLRLDELERGDVLVYDIPLCPFKVDELEYYLAFKLSSVGYVGGELFDDDIVQKIWKDTRGVPASVNQIAHNLLLNHAVSSDEGGRLGLPIIYMAILVVLLAALIMAIFYVGDEAPANTEPQDIVKQPVIEEVLDPEPSPLEEKLDRLIASSGANDSEPLDVKPVDTDLVVKDDPVPLAAQVLEQKDVSSAVAEAVAEPKVEVPVVSAPKPKAVIIAPPRTAQAPAQPSIQSKGVQTVDADAVMFWPKNAYTLQVMAAGQLPSIRQFVSRQSNRHLLRVVAFERNGLPWYVVLVGVYESSNEARLAIANLPKSQSRAKPWPRKVSEVQSKITSFRRR